MRDFVKVIFYPPFKKVNKKGFAPIYCRITVKGRRSEISTGIFVKREEFRNGGIVINSENNNNLQKQLDYIKNKLNRIETDLRLKEKVISAEIIKSIYLSNSSAKDSFSEIAQEYLFKKEKMIGLDIKSKTFSKYSRTVLTINEFILFRYKRKDFAINEIKQAFAEEFYLYCRTEKKHDLDYIRRSIRILKSILNYAVINDYTEKNYLIGFSIKIKDKAKDIKHLSIEQLRILRDSRFSSYALNYVRDCFLFQCFTGLSHVDLMGFSEQNIVVDATNKKWIIVRREKTSSKSTIPLIPEAEEIINRYDDLNHRTDTKITNSGLLPVYVNQVYNRLLKEIALICNIPQEVMTSHVARKTFAMTILNSGVSLESVSKMLGHTKMEITQKHYAFVDTKRIANEMQDFSITKLLNN